MMRSLVNHLRPFLLAVVLIGCAATSQNGEELEATVVDTDKAIESKPIFDTPDRMPFERTSFEFALIGDMPYSVRDVDRFGNLIQDINAETAVEWVLHAGDIKTGASPCSDAFLTDRLDLYQRFKKPFIFTPGDNEWTDCHRLTAGGFKPLERLAKLRSLFFPNPGYTLGTAPMQVESQATDARFKEFPEHVRWTRSNIVFVNLHIVGSLNGMAPFQGRTEADDAEVGRRTAAAIAWMEAAFEKAAALNSPGVFIMIHANLGFPSSLQTKAPEPFQEFLKVLERETLRFGKPVLLAHGDSHYFRIDKPLITSTRGIRVENFTRVETFGARDVHWLRITVDPADANVFSIRQEIVEANKLPHRLPDE